MFIKQGIHKTNAVTNGACTALFDIKMLQVERFIIEIIEPATLIVGVSSRRIESDGIKQ